MAEQDTVASIADSSKPNTGRIYDYLLGGNHNFEVDRLAAQQIAQIAPAMPHFARLVRWFLGEAVRRLVEEGYECFLDFASGLPTVDHIHQLAPHGVKVIYSDIDPITVAYGREIIKGSSNARYVQGDCGRPEEVLSSPVVAEMFGANRKVAIGFSGIAWFLPDEMIRHAMKALYDWAGKGSKLFFSDFDTSRMTDDARSMMSLYEQLGQPGYPRSTATLTELMGSWTVLEPGFLPLEQWVEIEKNEALQSQSAIGGFLQGVILGR
jgi:hypothetical protein